MGLTHFPNGIQTDYDGAVAADIANLSAASTDYVTLPFDAEIIGASCVAYGNQGATASTVGFTNGTTSITGLTITVAANGAAGTVTTASAITAGANWSANTALTLSLIHI